MTAPVRSDTSRLTLPFESHRFGWMKTRISETTEVATMMASMALERIIVPSKVPTTVPTAVATNSGTVAVQSIFLFVPDQENGGDDASDHEVEAARRIGLIGGEAEGQQDGQHDRDSTAGKHAQHT